MPIGYRLSAAPCKRRETKAHGWLIYLFHGVTAIAAHPLFLCLITQEGNMLLKTECDCCILCHVVLIRKELSRGADTPFLFFRRKCVSMSIGIKPNRKGCAQIDGSGTCYNYPLQQCQFYTYFSDPACTMPIATGSWTMTSACY